MIKYRKRYRKRVFRVLYSRKKKLETKKIQSKKKNMGFEKS